METFDPKNSKPAHDAGGGQRGGRSRASLRGTSRIFRRKRKSNHIINIKNRRRAIYRARRREAIIKSLRNVLQ